MMPEIFHLQSLKKCSLLHVDDWHRFRYRSLIMNPQSGTGSGTRYPNRHPIPAHESIFCVFRYIYYAAVPVVFSQDIRPQRSPVCKRPLIFPDDIRHQTTPCSACKRPHKADHLHPRARPARKTRSYSGDVRQVSQCGKPHCTAQHKSLAAFTASLNLPGALPLGSSARATPSAHPARPTLMRRNWSYA